jgi:hypothetical protein
MTFNRKKFILKAKWGTLVHGECLEFFLQKFFSGFITVLDLFLSFSALTFVPEFSGVFQLFHMELKAQCM